MLTRFYCDNYKCLVNFEFRPTGLQLLMGRNGAGKSTVFEVLELLRDFAARGEPCDERFVGKTLTRWQSIRQQHFEIEVTNEAEDVYVYKLVVEEAGQPAYPRIVHESVTLNRANLFLFEKGTVHLYNDSSVEKVKFPLKPRGSGLAIVESRPENKKLIWLKDWLGRLLYIQIDPKTMGARAEKEAIYPLYDLANFAEWYRHLRLEKGGAMEPLRQSLADVIDGFESLDLKDAGLNTRLLQVAVRMGGKSISYAFDELSDGQRALIGLYTVLHGSAHEESMLCIDEPDNFVALSEIQPWLSLLEDARDSGLQVLVASHHPELLNQLATKFGALIVRVDGRHSAIRPFQPEDDSTLTPAQIVARGWESVQ